MAETHLGADKSELASSGVSSFIKMMANSGKSIGDLIKNLHDPAAAARGLLQCTLSVQSHRSPTSMWEMNCMATSPDTTAHQLYREIGRGTCGKVIALAGVPKVAKIPLDSSLAEKLYNDCCMHKRIEDAFNTVPSQYSQDLAIPKFEQWIAPDAVGFWKRYGPLILGDSPSFCLLSERIDPLPAPIRQALVRTFAPPTIREKEFIALEENTDCLVRIYMSRRMKGSRSGDGKKFSLRNFELHIDEMETLGLPLEEYATIMANAYAVMHWEAQIDADDVEFVLGTSPPSRRSQTLEEIENGHYTESRLNGYDDDATHRSIGMWLLDFNNCKSITLDARGVEMLIRAFWDNDPYAPRPSTDHDLDAGLWAHFRQRYLGTSHEFLAEENRYLAQMFIDGVESEGQKWRARRMKAGEGSLFAAIAK